MTGAKVRIIKGTYKGYTGTIRDMQDTKVQVSLDAKFKVITIPKDQVRAVDAKDEHHHPPAISTFGSVMSPAYTPGTGGVGALYRGPPSTMMTAAAGSGGGREPKTPAIFEEEEVEEVERKPTWLNVGVVAETSEDGERGEVVRLETSEGRARMKMENDGSYRSIRFSEVRRAKPRQGDRVKVMRGEEIEGELMGYQKVEGSTEGDAVIMDEEGEVKVVDARDVVVISMSK
jgi:transcription elongation factor